MKTYEEFTEQKLNEKKVGGIYIVTGQAFNPSNGEKQGKPRDEEIDIDNNKLFKNCKSILDIHDAYEDFWNHLNDNPQSLVFVTKITKK